MKNSIYLQYEWFSGDTPLTDDQRNDYIYMLQDNGIIQQFCDIGFILKGGSVAQNGTLKLNEWIRMSRMVDPNQKIILVLNYGKRKTDTGFGTITFNKKLEAAISALMTRFKPDGIHLDIEGFVKDDLKLLSLLKLLKGNVLANSHLSISTPASVWDATYITKIAAVVDQMNPMIYDLMGWGSPVVDEETFKLYFKNAVIRYANLINGACELVPTFPVYEQKIADDGTIYHDPNVETMKAAIEAVNESGVNVDGAGIFYGSHFLGLNPNVYANYQQDQKQWITNWLKI